MEKLLVIGVDTLAGGNLALSLRERCEVVGLAWSAGFELEGCRILSSDAEEDAELAEIITAERPQLVVYCGPVAAASWETCAAIDANGETIRVKTIEKAAVQCGARMILLSTDAIFGGPRLFHRETFPTANTDRAIAVRQIEQALTGDTLVLRTHLFGWSPQGKSFAERTWSTLTGGGEPKVLGTCYASPILASDVAPFVWQAYRRKLSGLYHLGGAERISQWKFAMTLAGSSNELGHKSRPLAVASAIDISMVGEETSLDSRRLQRMLAMPLPLAHEGVRRFLEQADNGYRQQLRGGVIAKLPELTAA